MENHLLLKKWFTKTAIRKSLNWVILPQGTQGFLPLISYKNAKFAKLPDKALRTLHLLSYQ
jgi:hypothetical protein